jgi:hypothetical protein
MTQLGWVMRPINAVPGDTMKELGKSTHMHRGSARRAAGIGQPPVLIRPEVMHTLTGSRHVRLPAGCHPSHWPGESVRMHAPED